MKKSALTFAVTLISVISVISGLAQSPEKLSYQAVVRDASDNLVTNQSVGMQISILQGSAGGTAVYVETQTPTTNTNGLVTIEIGSGTVVTGDFTTIDWTNGPYFIKTETDLAGGANYTITGTSQLLSVPYALHAKTAGSVTGTITETDPVFGSSVANSITASDTANWNNHTIDTDTQLDSTGVAALGYVAGAHTVDTDTQLDSTGVATLGFVAGAHTIEIDADSTNELQNLSLSGDTLFLSNGNYILLGNLIENSWRCGDDFTDVRDGKIYKTVKIGVQCWMAKTLNYGNYVTVATGQGGAGTQKYCQNLSGVDDPICPLGGLYEWDEMMDGSTTCNGTGAPPNDKCVTVIQGICPTGWHIPSHYEWTTLEKNIGSNPGAFPYDIITSGWLGTDEGGNLKQTGITNWTSPNTATNSSGFTALPGGSSLSGSFGNVGNYGYGWSSTESSGTNAWFRGLYYTEARSARFNANKLNGFYVRCVKD